MLTIIFVTHSTSLDNEGGLASGQYDIPLSPSGRRQAQELGERHLHDHLDSIYCSDLQRSYRTGEIAFGARRDLPLSRDARLRECDYGLWTRFPAKMIEAERSTHIDIPFPGGESYCMAVERIRLFLVDLAQDQKDQRVMIIGHRATQYGLEHWLAKRDLREVVLAPWTWQPSWTYTLDDQLLAPS